MTDLPLLTLLTLTPLIGVVVIMALPATLARASRPIALGTSLLTLLEGLLLASRFRTDGGQLQFIERAPWIPSVGAEYFVGADGLNLLLILLTTLLIPFAIATSTVPSERPRLYFILILALETGLLGNFTALNFVHWFLYWELGLVPAYFLIKFWGGPGRRAAALQFFLFTFAGSVALLLAFQALFLATGTMDFPNLAASARDGSLSSGLSRAFAWTGLNPTRLTSILFLGTFAGLAVKVPLVPFHTWLPDTYAEAPTSVTLLLTGALSKMGVYGILRILIPIFPTEARTMLSPILLMVVVSIVFPALVALAQSDLKRILAYSSINHLGYCLLGIFAALDPVPQGPHWANERASALNGAVLQMFNHGINAALLFALVGILEQRTGGRRQLEDFGGLRARAPVLAGILGTATFASLGLPGLSGFIGEFLIFKGSFPLAPGAAVLALPGLMLTAVFLLTLLHRVLNGPENPARSEFQDLSQRECLVLAPMLVLLVLPGILPQLLLRWTNPSVAAFTAGLAP
ncbi:MAG: NADH-quinone oxidoreductase subunit M [Verrucomicrobiota bacterium]